MTREQRVSQNIAKWRSLSRAEKSQIVHATSAQFAANSMAMEGEPVSQEWLDKNISHSTNNHGPE